VDEREARPSNMIETARKQIEELLEEYSGRPDATVAGTAYLREQARIIVGFLDNMKRTLGDGADEEGQDLW
jgi:hypothetical protein